MCCIEWSMLGGVGKMKTFIYLAPSCLLFPIGQCFHHRELTLSYFQVMPYSSFACQPLCMWNIPDSMYWDELSHSNLKVEGKDKNYRHAAHLPHCVAAAKERELDTHKVNDWLGLSGSTVGQETEDHGNLKQMITFLSDRLNLRIDGDFRT